MEVENCRSCKRLFNYISGPRICPACRDKLEDKFIQVREYVRENPNKNISDISRDMDVSMQQINNWIRQERLVFTEDSDVTIACEKCGAAIRTGRYCENCKKKVADQMESLYKGEDPVRRQHEIDKMRHLK